MEHDVVGAAVDRRLVGAGIDLLGFEGGKGVGSTACDVGLQLHQDLQGGLQFLLTVRER